jgi:para-aminobenzoate synthetase component I
MRIVPLALRRDPLDVLASLAGERGAFLLEVPDPVHPATLIGCAPTCVLTVSSAGVAARSDGGATPRDPLEAIERFVAETPSATGQPFPLTGGVVGWLAYELGRCIEPVRAPARSPEPDGPLAVLARYDPMLVYERTCGQYALVCADPASARASWLERLSSPLHLSDVAVAPLASAPLAPLLPRERYLDAVRRILDYLAAGDAYQVNLTQPFVAPLVASAPALYARLARTHPVPYGAYFDLGGAQLVANSPELFLRRRGDRLETRPIKGTRARGASPARDAALAAELARDPKEGAEHVMIVDLERNDLGRVSATGSVAVDSLARIESLPSVHHLVSVIGSSATPGLGLARLLRATFPGGSITGAPKVRAMEIIRELEPSARGAYTGAFGLLHPGGDLELGLAIRTAVVRDGVVRYGAGGGIVADSDPERELAEAWLKTAALRLALGEDAASGLERCSSG